MGTIWSPGKRTLLGQWGVLFEISEIPSKDPIPYTQ